MKIKYWLPAIIVMALIFGFSSLPEYRVQQISKPGTAVLDGAVKQVASTHTIKIDWLKVGHVIGYAMLGSAFLYAYTRGSSARRPYPLALLSAFAYSLTDEFHQLFVLGRTSRWQDILIDTSAAAVMLVLLWVIQSRKARSKVQAST
jgi:VanZ family protein